ncbi:hypothetical protein [Jannaschia pohangensis]|uniref:hypothetical protein n=1 Tax=Jannaschia pohangensis TaxID=390807 RepID=UPI001C31E055|nr:hypothetical protein [Jannaschia pohangensis]
MIDAIERIRSRQTRAFVGPILRQDGSTWLRADETPTDDAPENMDFYLRGHDQRLSKRLTRRAGLSATRWYPGAARSTPRGMPGPPCPQSSGETHAAT